MISDIREIINEEDYNTIEEIAKKNHMDVNQLGKLLSKKVGRYLSKQVRFSEEELKIVDKKAKENGGLSRSMLCRLCFMKAYNEKLYENINVTEAYNVKREAREKVVHLCFDNAEEYNKMNELSKYLGIPFACLIRYFAMTVKL